MTNAVNIAQSGSNNVTMRNRIINGAMTIDQRNAGAAVTINNGGLLQFSVDRFFGYNSASAAEGIFTLQQDTVVPPGFRNSIKATVTTPDSSLSSGQLYILGHRIEGFNIADLAWGTANAQPITLSFWVRSSVTGTYGGSIRNGDNNRSYTFTYNISAANTWEQKSITIAGDTTGTWVTNNSIGMELTWGFGVGSTYNTAAGAWTSGNFISTSGATNLLATNGATFYITGVQLEEGTSASPFENRLYGTELQLCQRYFQIIAQGADQPIATSFYVSATVLNSTIFFKTTMRANPTLSITTGTNFYSMYRQSADDFVNSLSIDTVSPNAVAAANSSEASGTSGVAGLLLTRNASSFLAVQAEL